MQLRELFFVVFISIMVSTQAIADTSQKPSNFKMGDATKTICADGTHNLCSTLPTNMKEAPVQGLGYEPSTDKKIQTFIDYFGWQSFVALNWPLGKDGKPSTTETIVTEIIGVRVKLL